jgi:hypothetical protein
MTKAGIYKGTLLSIAGKRGQRSPYVQLTLEITVDGDIELVHCNLFGSWTHILAWRHCIGHIYDVKVEHKEIHNAMGVFMDVTIKS